MMLSISISDLQRITVLSHLNEFEIVSIHNDELVAKYLYQIGMDCYDYPIVYTAHYHRNLADEIVLGYRCSGEVRCDVAYRNSYLAGITERLVISAYFDRSNMEEIAELAYKVRDLETYLNDSDSLEFDESRMLFYQDQLEPDWEAREAEVKKLQDILFDIRGSCYNSSGALKTMKEYKEFADTRQFYEEKYDTN